MDSQGIWISFTVGECGGREGEGRGEGGGEGNGFVVDGDSGEEGRGSHLVEERLEIGTENVLVRKRGRVK